MHQNEHVLEALHRRELHKRQRVIITTTITRPHTTATLTATVIRPPTRPTTTDEDEETTRPTRPTTTATSTSSTTSVSQTSSLPTTTSTTSTTSTSTTSTASTTSPRALTSISSTTSSPILTSATRTNTGIQQSATSGVPDTTSSSSSTGTIIGIVVGILGGVIVIAILAGFIVRRVRKQRIRKDFDADKFRRDALTLNEPKESHTPRPPSMIERRAANNGLAPPGAAYPYSDSASQYSVEPNFGGAQYGRGGGPDSYGAPAPYGAPNPQGAPPMPYSGQNMYNQFPDRNNYGAGYGAGAGVGAFGGPAPYSQNFNQHPGQQFHPQQTYSPSGYPNNNYNNSPPQSFHSFAPGGNSVPGTPIRSNTPGNLPNPFAERAPVGAAVAASSASYASSSSASSSPPPQRGPTPPAKHAGLHAQNADDDSAPPAYSDDGTYAHLQRDVKNPVVMTVEGTSSNAAAAPAPAPAASKSAAAASASAATGSSDKPRPTSSYTVYDPNDAYGGM